MSDCKVRGQKLRNPVCKNEAANFNKMLQYNLAVPHTVVSRLV